jgi:deoxyribodipyrimidine photo-lyase
VREALQHLQETVGLNNGIARQLYFREFYFQVMDNNPELLNSKKNRSFLEKWENYSYENNSLWLNAWKEGKTGFPIIDAGIRQMLKTGFMHNRVRMLAASLLNKDMGIDWREGEKYFAQKLYDYDPSQNNAGWQSTCGMGASALDWNRVMNPWTQTLKFDPEAVYIQEWIPELRDVPVETIMNWNDQKRKINEYPLPIVNHSERAKIYLEKTKKFLSSS